MLKPIRVKVFMAEFGYAQSGDVLHLRALLA
jgi:hypothetical protein